MNQLVASSLALAAILSFSSAGSSAEPGAAIEKLGGKVTRNESLPDKPVIKVHIERYLGPDTDLEPLKSLSKLRELRLSHTQATDVVFGYLENLKDLDTLSLDSCYGTTDAGLEHLKRLTKLRRLSLSYGIRVTDAGLEHLKGLKQLKTLNLYHFTGVTDAGLKHLEGLENLQVLDLAGCKQVSDVGLEHLKGLTNLFSLGLPETNVTETGVTALEEALPHTQIFWPHKRKGKK